MSFARDITTVGGGTLVSRLLAYFRDAGIAALLGAGPFSEAFFAVLQVVNFFRRLLAEGALNAAFVPIWLKLRGGEDGVAKADQFTRRSVTAMFLITGIVALAIATFPRFVIAAIAPGFDSDLRLVASLYLVLAACYIMTTGVVAVIAAALNAEGRVTAAAVSTVMFNIVMVAALVIVFLVRVEPFTAGLWLAMAITVAGVVQVIITLAALLLADGRWKRGRPRGRVPDQTQRLFTRALPGMIAAGIPQLKLIAAAAIVSSSQAAVSWLYYANRLYELPLGVVSIAVTAVIVPRIAAALRSSDTRSFAAAQSRAFEIALGLALPAATGFAVLATPIAGGLFERGAFSAQDTAAVAAALAAMCAGLPGHVLEKVFGAVSFAHEDTHTPMLAALCGLAAAIAGGILLYPRYGHAGVAAAIAISGWVGATLLGITLYWRGWLRLDADATRRLPRILVATIVMGGAVAYGHHLGHSLLPATSVSPLARLALLLILVSAGVAVYAAVLQALGVARLKDLAAAVRTRA